MFEDLYISYRFGKKEAKIIKHINCDPFFLWTVIDCTLIYSTIIINNYNNDGDADLILIVCVCLLTYI